MRILHPVHRRWSIAVFSGIFIFMMIMPFVLIFLMIISGIFYMMIVSCIVIMSGRFFVFSPDLGAISAYCFSATLDEFIIFFITLPPIAIHETTREQVPLYCL